MIRSANHSAYPSGAGPGGDETAAAIVVAEQSRAFVDVVTDGQVRWSGPLSHLARHLDGMGLDGTQAWVDPRLTDGRPVLEGPIRWRGPFLVEDWRAATGVTPKPVKVALPGPVTVARLALDRHYGDLARAVSDLAAALAAEVAALAEAGCRWFQLDEPLLGRHPGDLDLVASSARTVLAAAPDGATTILSTYFAGLDEVAGGLDRLPGTHLGLDVTGPGALDLIDRLPPGRGVALGLFDARSEEVEDAAEVAARLAPHRAALEGRDLLVGPNAGLAGLPRDVAFDKLLHARYLGEELRRAWRPARPAVKS